MKLNKLAIWSLSLLALAGCSSIEKSQETYSLIDNGYKCLVNSQGEEIAVLDDKFATLTSSRTYKNKIVAMGDLDFGQMTTIIDTDNGKIIDSFMHFYLTNPWDENRPALQSPSGRYLLFRKYHSPFSEEQKTSNFVMVYDLDLSPVKNRETDFSEEEEDVICGKLFAGKFFYPHNTDFECSTCSKYKTLVYDDENYTYILGNKWDTPKTVLQVSYPKVGVNDFLVVEETDNGLTQKLLKFKEAKLYDVEGKELTYTEALEDNFYMIAFELDGNKLSISNLKDSSQVAKIVFEL